MDKLKLLNDKIKLLEHHVTIVKCLQTDGSKTTSVMKELHDKQKLLQSDVDRLKQLLQEELQFYNELQAHQSEVQDFLNKIDQLQVISDSTGSSSFLSGTSPLQQDHSVTTCNLQDHSDNSENLCVPSKHEACYMSPVESDLRSSGPYSLKPKRLIFDMAYLTDAEFKLLPKYMVGRLKLFSVNQFIDKINDAFTRKYEMLSKDPSCLKTKDLQLQNSYKRKMIPEMKDKDYIIEEDILREVGQTVLDKRLSGLLTILRHTKRLQRSVVNGIQLYLLCDSTLLC